MWTLILRELVIKHYLVVTESESRHNVFGSG